MSLSSYWGCSLQSCHLIIFLNFEVLGNGNLSWKHKPMSHEPMKLPFNWIKKQNKTQKPMMVPLNPLKCLESSSLMYYMKCILSDLLVRSEIPVHALAWRQVGSQRSRRLFPSYWCALDSVCFVVVLCMDACVHTFTGAWWPEMLNANCHFLWRHDGHSNILMHIKQ